MQLHFAERNDERRVLATESGVVDAQVPDEHFLLGQVLVRPHDRAVRARDLGHRADLRQTVGALRDAAAGTGSRRDRQISRTRGRDSAGVASRRASRV